LRGFFFSANVYSRSSGNEYGNDWVISGQPCLMWMQRQRLPGGRGDDDHRSFPVSLASCRDNRTLPRFCRFADCISHVAAVCRNVCLTMPSASSPNTSSTRLRNARFGSAGWPLYSTT